ncbi:MAG: TlpA family protein disulfide reductase [Candidatus Cloacimonetes bacterium]|nr:TlpA family protein disulfide reductase [Candidatus Cloacimonadota bacterium]
MKKFILLIFISLLFISTASSQDNSKIKIIENYDDFTHLSVILARKEFENKVVYVDVWGVGCRPCREESEYLPALKQRYKNKDLVFLYLAIPFGFFRISKWKKEMQEYNLEGYHIYMNKKLEKNLKTDVPGIKQIGIPKYVLIDKDGSIAYPDAPRPSSGNKLYMLIDILLGESF